MKATTYHLVVRHGRLVRDANGIGFILIPPLVFDPEGSDPKGGRTDEGVRYQQKIILSSFLPKVKSF